jgi:hypothetical protein
LYLFFAVVVVVVLSVWLSPLGLIVNLLFAIAAGYLGIVIGRRVLGEKICDRWGFYGWSILTCRLCKSGVLFSHH